MKFLTLASLMLSFAASAFAQDYGQFGWEWSKFQKIEATSLHLLGSGVKARGTNDSMAMACVDSNCTEISLVYFSGGEAYFFGQRFSVTSAEELKSTTAKALNESFTIRYPQHKKTGGGMILLLGGAIVGGFLLPVTSVPLLVDLGISSIVALSDDQGKFLMDLDLFGFLRNQFPTRALNSKGQDAILKQDGWSWATSPKKISKDRFCDSIVEVNYPELDTDSPYQTGNYTPFTWRSMRVQDCLDHLNGVKK